MEPPRLALCNFLPLARLAFWLWPTGQRLCAVFDEWRFHPSNALLANNPIWLHGWAIASLRPFDAVVGIILLVLFFIRMLFAKFAGHASAAHSFASKPAPTRTAQYLWERAGSGRRSDEGCFTGNTEAN